MKMNKNSYKYFETFMDEIEILTGILEFNNLLKVEKSIHMEKIETSLLTNNVKKTREIKKALKELKQELSQRDRIMVVHLIKELQKSLNPYQKIIPSSREEFIHIVNNLIHQFKDNVELMDGYKLVWNDDGNIRHEKVFQTLFYLVMYVYFRSANIVLSWGPKAGCGRVDFRVSATTLYEADIEFKKSEELSKQTIENQLITYMKPGGTKIGFCVVFLTDEGHKKKVKEVERIINNVEKKENVHLFLIVIDVTPHKTPASKIRSN